MVAIPRLLNTLLGKLPVGVLMPMITGIGPVGAPSGRLTVAVITNDWLPSWTVIDRVPPAKLASTTDGFPGFSPTSYSSKMALISARRQDHSARDDKVVPSALVNG